MTLIIVLIIFKSLCVYLQNIVLNCYDRFLNPRRKYYTGGGGSSQSGSSYQSRGYRLGFSTPSSALSKARANEREQLLEQIRARKRAAKMRT